MAATATQQQPMSITRWIPSLPAMLMNPFGMAEPDNSSKNSDDQKDNVAVRVNGIPKGDQPVESRPPLHSTFSFGESDASPSPSRTSRSSFFAEPETTNSLSAGSREGSIDGKRLSRGRPKTHFSVCHAPPESRTRQRLHRRPRSLLQLHRLRDSARPMPAFEVVPSTNFSLSLNAAVTRVFMTKHGLHPHDLVVLKAEKYSMQSDEEDELRDVIGLICKGGRKDDEKVGGGGAKIIMADGKTWDAYPISNGGYEFNSVDKNGLALTVRWVPKRNKDGSTVGKDGLRRFNFSTISPNTRRHPVIAALSKTALDINDTYRLPDPSPPTPLGTPKASTTFLQDVMDDELGDIKQTCDTDPHLRELITITSIFVTFKENWSPSFKYSTEDCTHKPFPSSPSKSAMGSPMTSPPGSPALSPNFHLHHQPLEKRGSIKSISSGIVRRTSLLNSRSKRNSLASNPEDDAHNSPSRSSSITNKINGRARADSSSTVLVHRAASNRRKNNQQWRPELLGAKAETVQEGSREDLSRVSESRSRKDGELPKPSPLATGIMSQRSSWEKDDETRGESVTSVGSKREGKGDKKTGKEKKTGKKAGRLRRLLCVSGDSS
ncbi:uncharacterized protein RCC_12091 [Ramularia collo-cygni]|uniref:Uncharacterized protein n=1 Tax=Ramularia collo-cygni TaxID=112498 RepID=A0A2D3V5A9_9PEZI|nr:uncharacterized protein RCC_12091 [Ramularia collo-cygni]CZT15453.1 uncharacterized protein RCC_12091 [Ramularia collo-cygni]